MLNQVSFTFIICFKQYFVMSYLKLFFFFGLKWFLISLSSLLQKRLTCENHASLAIFIIPFSSFKKVSVPYPKAYGLKKKKSSLLFFLNKSYNFLCGECLEVFLNFVTSGCRQLFLHYHSTKRYVSREIQITLYHL